MIQTCKLIQITILTEGKIHGLPFSSLYAPIDRLTFFESVSLLNAYATPNLI